MMLVLLSPVLDRPYPPDKEVVASPMASTERKIRERVMLSSERVARGMLTVADEN